MSKVNADYKLEALDFLLDKDCILERYYPLIPYKSVLVSGLKNLGCARKSDAEAQSDEALLAMLGDCDTVRLFKRFLSMYDADKAKFKELADVTDEAEKATYSELYLLPGVKLTRASLYCRSGYKTLKSIAETTAEELIKKTEETIRANGLSCKAPFAKEARTHIAVSKAFTM